MWIRNWAGASATGGTQIQLQAPTIREVGGSKSFPAIARRLSPSSALYTTWSRRRHGELRALPFLELGHAAAAVLRRMRRLRMPRRYAAIKSKINLDNPAQSRLVVRLRDEFHNCWGSAGCAANAQTMLDAINAFADRAADRRGSARAC